MQDHDTKKGASATPLPGGVLPGAKTTSDPLPAGVCANDAHDPDERLLDRMLEEAIDGTREAKLVIVDRLVNRLRFRREV